MISRGHEAGIQILAERCSAQISDFRRDHPSDETPCIELFRLALIEHNQEAWESLYHTYYPLVTRWVSFHPGFRLTGEDVDYFANQAFARFWRYGAQRASAGCFRRIADYLQYLKRCAWSAIEDELRWIRKDALGEIHRTNDSDASEAVNIPEFTLAASDDRGAESFEQQIGNEASLKKLRRLLCDVLTNEDESLVAEATWQQGLSPRQIHTRYPGRFADESEVSQIRRNILRRLTRRLMNDAGAAELRQELEELLRDSS